MLNYKEMRIQERLKVAKEVALKRQCEEDYFDNIEDYSYGSQELNDDSEVILDVINDCTRSI